METLSRGNLMAAKLISSLIGLTIPEQEATRNCQGVASLCSELEAMFLKLCNSSLDLIIVMTRIAAGSWLAENV